MVDFKKELHFSDLVPFRRKPRAGLLSPEAASRPTDRKPWWKRDLRIRRKPKTYVELAEAGVFLKPSPPSPAVISADAAPADSRAKTSLWKRKLSFRRGGKQPAAEHAVAEERAAQSIGSKPPWWKKDISVRRKKGSELTAAGEASAIAPPAPQAPWWKKGVPFGRKKEPAPQVVTAVSAVEHSARKSRWWKQELSLGRKRVPVHGSDVASAPLEPEQATPRAPWWKKEVSLGRSRSESRTPEHDSQPVEEPARAVEPAVLTMPVPAEGAPAARDPQVDVSPLDSSAARPNVGAAAAAPAAGMAPARSAPDEAELSPELEEEALPEEAAATAAEQPTLVLASVPPVEPVPAAAVAPPIVAPEEHTSKPSAPRPAKRQSFSFLRRPETKRSPNVDQQSNGKTKRARGAHKVKNVVGLKIGASQIAAAHVSNNGKAELVQVARQPLQPGIVVGGELREVDLLATALKGFFRRHRLPKRGIRLGISNNRIGVRVLEIEGIPDVHQLRNAIRFRAQEVLPIPLDEAVLDFQTVEESITAEGQKVYKVVLVVAYRDLVERYVAACRKAGLKLLGIDLEAFALLRSLGASESRPQLAGAGLVVVSVGHDRSTFAVSDGEVCQFTRVLDWGGSALNVAIAHILDLVPSEAEGIKRGLSLADSSVVPAGVSPEKFVVVREAVKRQLESFARDLVSSLRFYQSQPESLSIGEIVLTGGTTQLPGFAAELERLIGVQVRVGDPLGRVKLGKKIKQDEPVGSLAAAIGLGIEV